MTDTEMEDEVVKVALEDVTWLFVDCTALYAYGVRIDCTPEEDDPPYPYGAGTDGVEVDIPPYP